MSKLIKLTDENRDEIRKEFDQILMGLKLSDGKVQYTKIIGNITRKAKVFFTEAAWYKMQALIDGYDKEVGWHGIAYRHDDLNVDQYYITDIMVYPQEVTGATVTTDQEKYQSWLMKHDDDVFNNIRMQGHSHVNMAVSPSSVDTSLYDRILGQLTDDMFYIFMIWNKKGDKTVKIYDLKKNILFDTADCEIEVIKSRPSDVTIEGVNEEEKNAMLEHLNEVRYKKAAKTFFEESKAYVKEPVKTTPTLGSKDDDDRFYGSYNRSEYYGGYYDNKNVRKGKRASHYREYYDRYGGFYD